jgi:non-ribosomal peptide synthetase component F
MRRAVVFSVLLLFMIGDVAGGPHQQTPGLRIELGQDSEREKETADLLSALVQSYDLRAWTFTRTVRIEEGVIPHSHPVLTLNTRHLEDREQLLALFLHEQIHWFLAAPYN